MQNYLAWPFAARNLLCNPPRCQVRTPNAPFAPLGPQNGGSPPSAGRGGTSRGPARRGSRAQRGAGGRRGCACSPLLGDGRRPWARPVGGGADGTAGPPERPPRGGWRHDGRPEKGLAAQPPRQCRGALRGAPRAL